MQWPVICLLGAALGGQPSAPAACSGDCNGDRAVGIAELVRGVNIALGNLSLDACPAADLNGDEAVSINELIAAVNAALAGCPVDSPTPAEPSATSPAETRTPSPTETPGGPRCGDGIAQDQEECDDGNRVGGDGCSADCALEPGGDVCAGVPAQPGMRLTAVAFATGLDLPTHVTAPPLDPHRVFLVEQRGRIRIVKDGVLLDDPFLDIRGRVGCCGERGMLSVAFHPRFESTGRFFVNYTNTDGNTVIARYHVLTNPDRADPDSERILLTIEQPFGNHNGGQLSFGPDGYLYAGMGDGGLAGDPLDAGQDDETLLGKLLRMDVDIEQPPYHAVPDSNPNAGAGRPLGLIWAKGLRNPWRFSFDRSTGDLYIADVGQNRIEEIDVQPAASTGGENYGWDIFEGTSCFEPDPFPDCPDPGDGFTMPVVEYDHDDGCSVTGGFVYRGCALSDVRGTYFYSDFCSAFIRSFRLGGSAAIEERDWTEGIAPAGDLTIDSVTSFGEDARGELYIADHSGEVFKIVPAP